MSILARLAIACLVSLVVCGAVQQTIMIADHAEGPSSALPPLAVIVLLITAVFGLVMWCSRSAAAAGWTAASMLGVMLLLGTIAYVLGVSSFSPELGGNIGYGLAMIVDFYFLVPGALAAPVHWLLLRQARP